MLLQQGLDPDLFRLALLQFRQGGLQLPLQGLVGVDGEGVALQVLGQQLPG